MAAGRRRVGRGEEQEEPTSETLAMDQTSTDVAGPRSSHSPVRFGVDRTTARSLGPCRRETSMPGDKRPSVKNEKQYEALKDKGMSKERAAKIANSPGASKRGGKSSGKGGDSSQGGTTAQKKKAGRKGGKASH